MVGGSERSIPHHPQENIFEGSKCIINQNYSERDDLCVGER